MAKTYSIFGAGAAGLYTAWRLLDGTVKDKKDQGKMLAKGDTLELYDWGNFAFKNDELKTKRAPGSRICTWHYKDNVNNSYLELGGMRYSAWNGKNGPENQGHRVVTQVIQDLGLTQYSVPFNEATNPLYYLRNKNIYLNDISSTNPAPYNVKNFGQATTPYNGFSIIQDLAMTPEKAAKMTRAEWCEFYNDGTINVELPDTSVYKKGDRLKDIGYWDLMFDQLGSEGFNYTADGNGYTSNIINWNSAVAVQANNEFTPGNEYKTLTKGYSSMFNALYDKIVALAKKKGINFIYCPDTRLHSILYMKDGVQYSIATREKPNKKSATKTTDAAWLAMPRYAIELVAQATRYENHKGVDVLNHEQVQLYLEAAIMQPSYKVGMFFKEPWWSAQAATPPPYPAQIESYEMTAKVLAGLVTAKVLTKKQSDLITNATNPAIIETPYTPASTFIQTIESCLQERLTLKQEEAILAAAVNNTIGPSVTDMPIRQVVYFGHNAIDPKADKVYGILASYDDEQFTTFWQELEIGPFKERKRPISENYQPMEGPRTVPEGMVKMLRKQLAQVHFGPQADYNSVPEPIEAKYMDWSLPPYNAGYHAYAAHYDVAEVQRMVRKPSQMISGTDANIFIVGEAYSNDQAWVEGAYCTAESVLNDFFGMKPIIDNTYYPFICPASKK